MNRCLCLFILGKSLALILTILMDTIIFFSLNVNIPTGLKLGSCKTLCFLARYRAKNICQLERVIIASFSPPISINYNFDSPFFISSINLQALTTSVVIEKGAKDRELLTTGLVL